MVASPGPQHVGEAVAVLTVAGGFLGWLKPWRWVVAFFALFGHEARLTALEDSVATKTEMQNFATDAQQRDEAHEKRDVTAFAEVNAELAHIRENMAQKTDLARVEGNLTEILMDGFKRASR